MTLDEFKKYVIDLNSFTAAEIDEMTLMDNHELEQYQSELERNTGNLSEWDHLRALITLKAKVMMYEDTSVSKSATEAINLDFIKPIEQVVTAKIGEAFIPSNKIAKCL